MSSTHCSAINALPVQICRKLFIFCTYWANRNLVLLLTNSRKSSRKGLHPVLFFETIGTHGSMFIGNIHWKHCRLETSFEFGNINVCRKHITKTYWNPKTAHMLFEISRSFQLGSFMGTVMLMTSFFGD